MNTTALATIQGDELDTIQRTAKLLAASGYFGTSNDGLTGMAQVAAKILAGRELGFGPFAAVNGVHIIQGKPTVGANLMAAAVRSHPRYDYRVKKLTDKECELEFIDNGKVAGVSSFTMQDAEAAELSTGRNSATWKKYARNMLFARAMSNGVRFYAPDIFSGNAVYVPEELDVAVDGDGNVVDATFTVSHTDAPQRAQRATTPDSPGERADDARCASVPASEDVDSLGDEIFDVPWYVAARRNLTNGTALLADKMLDMHRNGDGQCSEKQHQYLSGLIDSLPGVGKDGHGKVLSVICQSEITSSNRPSFDLATKLLDYLPTHIKVDGNKVANPNYRADVVEHITKIANALQMALPLEAA